MRLMLLLVVLVPLVAAASSPDAAAVAAALDVAAPEGGMSVAVDLSRLPETGQVRSIVRLATPADRALVFPRWIPGTHAPSGRVDNLGGLHVRDAAGGEVAWQRDPTDPWRIVVASAPGSPIALDLVYLANHVDENSEGVDVESDEDHAILSWNCCLFAPAGAPIASLPCAAAVRLPPDWDYATALPTVAREGDVVRFAPLPLADVVDRPLITASSIEHLPLRGASPGPEVTLHVIGDEEGALVAPVLPALRRLPDEADALFGGAWFARYDMLLRIGSSVIGLEHATSSLNGLEAEGFDGPGAFELRALLPHEFTHSWVGKHRRPRGMLTPTYQETPDHDGLWVYEGLTELIGRVLTVRCGLGDAAQFRDALAEDLAREAASPGRRWRSIRDTCRCNWQLRGVEDDLKRGQEYYIEGAQLWLAIDRRLRVATAGRRSLEDFCRAFFGPARDRAQGFTEDELVATLAGLAGDVDWRALITRWIDGVGDLDVAAVLDGSGWRLEQVAVDRDTDGPALMRVARAVGEAAGLWSEQGRVRWLQPKGPAERAGLRAGDVIETADGVALKRDRLALVRALLRARGPVGATLSVRRDGKLEERRLCLPDLPRVPSLVRVDAEPDSFAALLAPRVAAPALQPVALPPRAVEPEPATAEPATP